MAEPTAPASTLSPSVVRPASGLRAWADRRAVPLVVGLTLAWSWGWWSLLWSYGGQGVLRQGAPAEAFLIAAVGGCGPSLAGLVLTALSQGRAGLAELRRRFGLWRLGRVWLLVGVAPLASLLLPLLRAAAGAPLDAAGWLDLLLPGLLLGAVAGAMEEIGWRGFLLPRLLQRHSPWVASIWIGLVWGGLWHGYADFFGLAGSGWAFWALVLLLGPGLLTAWSLLLTLLHLRSGGSLLAAWAGHASISASALIFAAPYPSLTAELGWTALAVALAWVLVLCLWFMDRSRASEAVAQAS
jgi:membrane protease YdiL (CAAX protease family)